MSTLNSGTVPEIKRHGGRRAGAGRPPSSGVSRERVSRAVGISVRTMGRIEEHVRLAELYGLPGEWTRTAVLRVGALLRRLPEDERHAAVALMLGRPASPGPDGGRP